MPIIFSPLTLFFSAVLMGLAQHSLGMGYLAWFSLVPFIFVLNRINEIKHYVLVGFIWGFTYYLIVIFWLANNIGTTPLIGMISMICAVLYCTLNLIFICLLIKILKYFFCEKWYWYFPFLWVSVEYIRNMDLLTGGPWTSLANTQLDFLTLIQNAEIMGIYGISFWIVLINILIYNYLLYPYKENLVKFIIIFMLPWLTGKFLQERLVMDDYKSLDVAIVQPNIHLSQKWKKNAVRENIQLLLGESKSAIDSNVDLIVWPETATSGYILQGNDYYLNLILKSLKNSKLISGIPYFSNDGVSRKYFNSAALMDSNGVRDIYHKIKLVPMAEHVPLSRYFPKLNQLNLGQGDFTGGLEHTIMNVDSVQCATLICFESTLPSLNRDFVNAGAEVLIYVVNDGWYETPPQPQQHSKQVIFRAIENRRPVLRCANTGISMFVDPIGNISHELQLNEKGLLQATIMPQSIITFYTRYGDIFAQLNIIVLLLILLVSFIRKR